MNAITRIAVAAASVWLCSSPPALAGDDGKTLFINEGCVNCHSVKSAGITVMESAEAKEELKEQAAEGAKAPPDLSGLAAKRDADFLDKYLRKKIAIDGRKHKKRFKGSDAERETLITWILALKPAAGQGK
ncbi:MAG: cytochrome c [Nitrospinae bacterium]|nr:cytochrome c [Nitrospinota bacterium]